MEEKEMYERGEVVIFDYADDEPRTIWGLQFEIGDAIAVLLRRKVTQQDLLREMGTGGPWAWGGFRTEWIESLAERIEWLYDSRTLYSVAESVQPVRSNGSSPANSNPQPEISA